MGPHTIHTQPDAAFPWYERAFAECLATKLAGSGAMRQVRDYVYACVRYGDGRSDLVIILTSNHTKTNTRARRWAW